MSTARPLRRSAVGRTVLEESTPVARVGAVDSGDSLQSFGTNACAVILHGDRKLVAITAGANLDAARITHLSDGLFGVGNKVQKNLNQLVGVPNDAGKIAGQARVHFNIVAAQGMFMQLQRALKNVVEVERF